MCYVILIALTTTYIIQYDLHQPFQRGDRLYTSESDAVFILTSVGI